MKGFAIGAWNMYICIIKRTCLGWYLYWIKFEHKHIYPSIYHTLGSKFSTWFTYWHCAKHKGNFDGVGNREGRQLHCVATRFSIKINKILWGYICTVWTLLVLHHQPSTTLSVALSSHALYIPCATLTTKKCILFLIPFSCLFRSTV